MQDTELLKKVNDYLFHCNKYLSKVNKKLNITVFGRLGLNLIGITQRKTTDFDIILEHKNSSLIQKLYEIAKENNLKVDIMKDSFVFKDEQTYQKMEFPKDYIEKSIETEILKQWNEKLSHIKIEVLNPADIIITKLLRFETKDKKDIHDILKEMHIDKKELKERYSKFKFDGETQGIVKRRYDSVVESLER